MDYKALTHSKAFLTEWARRLQYVYHLDYTSSPAGYATSSYADEQLGKLSTEELKQMYAEKGIGYLIITEHLLLLIFRSWLPMIPMSYTG